MEKRVYIPATTLPQHKKRFLMALGILIVGGIVAMQMKLTLTENAVAEARDDVQSAAAAAQEGAAETSPAQAAIEQFKETLEQTP